jgi:O-antigen/teichoic acid export membrane protein
MREARFQLPSARKHFSLNLILQSSSYTLPVLVALVAQPREVAYFNAAWRSAGALLTVPFMLTLALFAATADDESRLTDRIRITVPLGLVLASCCAALAITLGGEVMHVFGAAYASHGAGFLRLLVLAGPLLVIKDHYVAIRRVQGQLHEAARLILVATILEVTGALVGGLMFGVTGLCVGWLLALAVEACATGPMVVSAAQR